MKKQWLEVQGIMTPVILPQIWNHELQDWVVTSEQNPLPTQVTGSIVANDYLIGVELAPGSTVDTPILTFQGTRIGVGIRFEFSGPRIDFEVRLESAGKSISFIETSGEAIVIKKSNDYRGSGSVTLNAPRGRFRVLNNSDELAVLEGLTITQFMASGNGG